MNSRPMQPSRPVDARGEKCPAYPTMRDVEETEAPKPEQARTPSFFGRAGYFILPVLAVTLITYNLLDRLPSKCSL